MRTAGVAFVVSGLCAMFLTPLVRAFAIRAGLFDHAVSSRKVHARPVPRLGGLAIVGAFFAPLLGLLVADSGVGRLFYSQRWQVVGLFAGGAAIAALGVYDDARGADARQKFTVQFGVAALAYGLGYRIDTLATPFGDVALGWAGLPFTMLWIAGVVNALNLIDGLDGLAGGAAFAAVVTNLLVAVQRGDVLMALFSAALGGAILGFLVFNFNPASIFMGDCGAMFLGFVLAATSVQTHQKSSTAVGLLVPVIALGFPLADTLLAMIRRALRGVPLFRADREHIHHRLMRLGLTHRQTVLLLYLASTLLGVTAFGVSQATGWAAVGALAAVLGAMAAALWALGYLRLERAQGIVTQRQRNVQMLRAIRQAGSQVRWASEPEEVWESVKRAAPALGARCLALELELPCVLDGDSSAFRELADSGVPLHCARYSLLGDRPGPGCLELGFPHGKGPDRDTEIGIELLCDHIRAATERIRRERERQLAPPPVWAVALGWRRAAPGPRSIAEGRRVAPPPAGQA